MAIRTEKKEMEQVFNIAPERVVTREEIYSFIEKTLPNVSEDKRRLIEEGIYKMATKNEHPMAALGITEADIEHQYREAYNQFQAGKYKEAIALFRVLDTLDPFQYRYSFAIGAALQYQKKYSEAAGAYIIATKLDPQNPVPHYHLYDCFVKLNELWSAYWAISYAVHLAKLNKNYETLAAKAEMERKHLIELIEALYNEKEKAAKEQKGE